MPAVKTQKTDLGEHRVRVEVDVEPGAVEAELKKAAAELGRDMKLPGFRQGKVPPEVVLQRVGREAVLDDAVRRALPGWYEEAILDAKVVTVGDPKLDLRDLPEKGQPLGFTIEVSVRPTAALGDYLGIEVGRREPEADPEQVERELEAVRESLASLDTVEREAKEGDFVVLDFVGRVDGEPFEGGEARGYMLELGSGRLVPGFEPQLVGATAGEERDVTVTFPEDYAGELGGKEAVFSVTVKEVKEKRVPELDDELASSAAGFDTLDELRADIGEKLAEADEARIEAEFREAAVDAAAANAKIDLTEELVEAKARELWERTAHRLAHQGIDPRRYLEMVGKTEDEVIAEASADADMALRREATLAAIVEAESIEVSDDELLEALREASGAGDRPSDQKKLQKALKRIAADGRDELLREDIAMRKAVDLLVEKAKPIAQERADAREALWKPGDDEAAEPSKKLWTPGS
ncbi:MAG TPA: trigger factor [Thermoleophilaceae bacterium]|nr:trigger factor [Thermoleophilaceae bacterium]